MVNNDVTIQLVIQIILPQLTDNCYLPKQNNIVTWAQGMICVVLSTCSSSSRFKITRNPAVI